MAAVLVIDREVIRAMATPETRSACAARLAAMLEAAETTPAARQYICLQLRQAGTPAQVPLLAKLLATPETSEIARYALEAIPGEESLSALRDSLGALRGPLLIGAINSIGARRDARSVAKLQELARSEDPQVARAAIWALGNIADDQAADFLGDRAEKAGTSLPEELAVPLLRCADAMAAAGDADRARTVYTELSQAGQPPGVRRAAFEGLLRLRGDQAQATILAWLGDADADRRRIAAGHLAALSDEQLDRVAAGLGRLPNAAQLVLMEVLAQRKGSALLPVMTSAARSDEPQRRLAGIRGLGMLGDRSAIPLLVDSLAAGGEVAEAAQQSLSRLPREAVGPALLEALQKRVELRTPVIEVLKRLRYYEAIDPLVAIAAGEDPAVYEPALDGLRGIADPDDTDLPRLVRLWSKTEPGKHRDEVERTIVIVCEKLPAGADRAKPVLAALAKVGPSPSPQSLPLLGRLGGAEAIKRIEAALAGDDPEAKQAAFRALCNWPTADVADRLWQLANGDAKEFRRGALRAYVRVVTLKSDRPEAQTLAMLRKAMELADTPDDRQWVLARASTVRTMETVVWVASYLDDPVLGQAACQAIVELAHHRFLRHPNMDSFGPLLEKVSRISKDPDVAERAKKYRLGL